MLIDLFFKHSQVTKMLLAAVQSLFEHWLTLNTFWTRTRTPWRPSYHHRTPTAFWVSQNCFITPLMPGCDFWYTLPDVSESWCHHLRRQPVDAQSCIAQTQSYFTSTSVSNCHLLNAAEYSNFSWFCTSVHSAKQLASYFCSDKAHSFMENGNKERGSIIHVR